MKKSEPIIPAPDAPEKFQTTTSLYRGVVMACLRSKQLIKGATPRISSESSHKRKSTRIAVQEIKEGLISFEIIPEEI